MTGEHHIYLVVGSYSNYSDSSMWYVCWRATRAEAQAIVDRIYAEYGALGLVLAMWRMANPEPRDPDGISHWDDPNGTYQRWYRAAETFMKVASHHLLDAHGVPHSVHYLDDVDRNRWTVEEVSDVPRLRCTCEYPQCACVSWDDRSPECPWHLMTGEPRHDGRPGRAPAKIRDLNCNIHGVDGVLPGEPG